jgi:quercetin dioxygenase-like cupin family protein
MADPPEFTVKMSDEASDVNTAHATIVRMTENLPLQARRILCRLDRQERGRPLEDLPGAREQFHYVIHGTLVCEIDGVRVLAHPGSMLHTPPGTAHTAAAGSDSDVVLVAVGGIDADDDAAMHQVRDVATGTRRVYDMRADRGAPPGATSAEVTYDHALRLPPGIRGKLLTGERLHVGLLRFESGATLNNYRRDNDQLVFVIEGDIEVDLDEEPVSVLQRKHLHLPAGTRHELYAPEGALVLLAQDRHTE